MSCIGSDFQEIAILLDHKVQQLKERSGWEADHIVIVAFNFTDQQGTI
jgi:hypothetical protein